MKISEVFTKRLRHSEGGQKVARDVNAAVSGGVNERKSNDRASGNQRSRVSQRGDKPAEADLGPHRPPISPNLAAPVDAAAAFNTESGPEAETDT